MAIVVAHGAGSTGAAACALLGIARTPDVILVEDRTGDVDAVIAGIEAAVESAAQVTHVVGVSLGAHATARWAATSPLASPTSGLSAQIVCALPAWGEVLGSAAEATARAGERIGQDGISATLAALAADPASADVLKLLALAWAEYSDAELAQCLATASRSPGPDAAELSRIVLPATFVGWHHDDMHPAAVARDWAERVAGSRIAMGARPEARLLRRALATTLGTTPA